MFKLRYGYLLSGILTGSILLFSFILSIPDGKLRIIFCNVGQGDAAYIKFPDGRDMLVDGGPDDRVFTCLGRHMPFWDRHIDIVVMTHPQKDHMEGLIPVVERFSVGYFVHTDIDNPTEAYGKLKSEIAAKKIPVKTVKRGDHIGVGNATLLVIWPPQQQPSGEINDYSLVFALRYGSFDAFFPGDADSHVESKYTGDPLSDGQVEVLKVPHHGAKTGMTEAFVQWLHPKIAVISVGKNNYGHPSAESVDLLKTVGADIVRTDKNGDIEITSDGKRFDVR